ncbi:MAG TPA: gamma-glutamyl-gamma-aminobutyrate hydrolase family protein [Polyangia bacterium]|nr:gamma-glutamyl-gamma-aminobutyrate hydrolase family protein [Polyangia bacterium]
MRAIVLQHTATEGPERVGTALAARGVTLDVRPVFAGAPVPADAQADELVVVMGGPMGVGDAGDPRWPFLSQEIALLRKLVARDAPVLGICLGSQLLAAAAGARVYPNVRPGPDGRPVPAREVGWGPVDLLGAPGEPLLAGLPARPLVLHWHGDTFDLPAGAVRLASTPVCANQAFRLGRHQIGFQFHCELEESTIGVWAHEDAEFAREALGEGATERIVADTSRHYAQARPALDRLLANALDVLLAS